MAQFSPFLFCMIEKLISSLTVQDNIVRRCSNPGDSWGRRIMIEKIGGMRIREFTLYSHCRSRIIIRHSISSRFLFTSKRRSVAVFDLFCFQEEIVQECLMMIPNCKIRLNNSWTDLKTSVVSYKA